LRNEQALPPPLAKPPPSQCTLLQSTRRPRDLRETVDQQAARSCTIWLGKRVRSRVRRIPLRRATPRRTRAPERRQWQSESRSRACAASRRTTPHRKSRSLRAWRKTWRAPPAFARNSSGQLQLCRNPSASSGFRVDILSESNPSRVEPAREGCYKWQKLTTNFHSGLNP
jgi:hypothetical protein